MATTTEAKKKSKPTCPQRRTNNQRRNVMYGQVIVGPPGCGKTTYCTGMEQYLRLLHRNAWIVNLDPANNNYYPTKERNNNNNNDDDNNNTYEITNCLFDIGRDVVNLRHVMDSLDLGPNGGLVYCMEYMERHGINILIERIQQQSSSSDSSSSSSQPLYLLFDLPGQVELYTHGTSVYNLFRTLMETLDLRLAVVNMVDSTFCLEVHKFVAASLLCATTMIRLELPAINVLSKTDLLDGQLLPFGTIQYFTECNDLQRLVPYSFEQNAPNLDDGDDTEAVGEMEDEHYSSTGRLNDDDDSHRRVQQQQQRRIFNRKYEKLHGVLAEVVDDYNLLSYVPLNISNVESVARVVGQIDKCNGYIFSSGVAEGDDSASQQQQQQDLFQCAIQTDTISSKYESIADIQERLGGGGGQT